MRNDPDGSVFMEIQGTEEQIDRVFAMVSQGTYVNIEKMDAKSIPVVEDERGFHTRESLGDFWGTMAQINGGIIYVFYGWE